MNSICIFGVFVADLCFFAEKIPVKGETVLGKNHLVGPGGKGSNQAIAAARLNANVNFITKIGKDNHADMALKLYQEAGVKTSSIIQDENLSTGVAGIMIDENGNNAINIISGAAEQLNNQDIDKNLDILKKSKIFLTQMETPEEVTIYSLKKAKENECITVLNPAPARNINKDDLKFRKTLNKFLDNLETYKKTKGQNNFMEGIPKTARDSLFFNTFFERVIMKTETFAEAQSQIEFLRKEINKKKYNKYFNISK